MRIDRACSLLFQGILRPRGVLAMDRNRCGEHWLGTLLRFLAQDQRFRSALHAIVPRDVRDLWFGIPRTRRRLGHQSVASQSAIFRYPSGLATFDANRKPSGDAVKPDARRHSTLFRHVPYEPPDRQAVQPIGRSRFRSDWTLSTVVPHIPWSTKLFFSPIVRFMATFRHDVQHRPVTVLGNAGRDAEVIHYSEAASA
jgi:hypothetical protein